MIEKKTRQLFKAWLRTPDGGMHVGRVPDSYGTYVNSVLPDYLIANIFQSDNVQLLTPEQLDAHRNFVGYRRLTLVSNQINPNARLSNVKVGLGAFEEFITWLLEFPFVTTFDDVCALIDAGSTEIGGGANQGAQLQKPKGKGVKGSAVQCEVRDAYQLLFDYFSQRPLTPENFYQFGLEKSIFADRLGGERVVAQFNSLINLLEHGTCGVGDDHKQKDLHIRKYSGSKTRSGLYTELYKKVFPNANIIVEGGGNTRPKENLKKITKCQPYSSSEAFHVAADIEVVLKNYQCSHVLDNRTKNPLLFEAAWNLVFTPKMIDPLTGHETLGRWPREFQPRFRDAVRKRFHDLMKQFNDFADKYRPQIQKGLDEVVNAHPELGKDDKERFISDALAQWEPVRLEFESEDAKRDARKE